MAAIDEPRFPAFDPSAFVNYNSEADITPTEAELIEELPEYELTPAMKAIAEGKPLEKPLRRGIGYLRAETAPEDSPDPHVTADAVGDDDFGAGLTNGPSGKPIVSELTPKSAIKAESHSEPEAKPNDSVHDSSSDRSPGRKRRRRSRKRRSSGNPTDLSSSATTAHSDVSSQPQRSNKQSPATDGDAAAAGSGQPRSKRNRRRRRRKTGGESGPASGAPSSGE